MEQTFLRQLASHKKLHAFEFILSSLMFGFLFGCPTLFRYPYVVLAVAAAMGFLTVLYFVTQEHSCAQHIFRLQRNPSIMWSEKIYVEDKYYGRYSSLQIRAAELSVLTSYSYIVRLFFTNFWWGLGKIFQFVGIMAIVAIALGVREWFVHPVLIHSYITSWLNTDHTHMIDVLLRKWASIGEITALVFLWPSTFAGSDKSHGDKLREKRVAKILTENRWSQRHSVVYREKMDIRLRYLPDKLSQWELDHLSEHDTITLKHYHPDMSVRVHSER